MQFAVIARDADDEGALERRAQTRPLHLTSTQPHVERGSILVGGALLNDDDEMIGSVLIVDFPSRADVDAWLEVDPYVTQGVWTDVEVKPYRPAVGTWLGA